MIDRVFAIDPGEVHCGVAEIQVVRGKWVCTAVVDLTPEDLERRLEFYLLKWGDRTDVVIEEFRLYPWLANQQGLQEMITSEVIGSVRSVCRRTPLHNGEPYKYPALNKKPADGYVRTMGLQLQGNRHEQDAQLHGWYHLVTRGMINMRDLRKVG